MPSRKPLYSTDKLPIYGLSYKPVYADGVIKAGLINIIVKWSAYPDLDIAVGFTGATGVGWSVTAGTASEMAALSWASGDDVSYGPEWVYVDVNKMIDGNCGKGNDGTNDYYDIRVAAGWYTTDATGASCIVRAIYGSHGDTTTITGLGNNDRGPATSHVATVRWTPATETLTII